MEVSEARGVVGWCSRFLSLVVEEQRRILALYLNETFVEGPRGANQRKNAFIRLYYDGALTQDLCYSVETSERRQDSADGEFARRRTVPEPDSPPPPASEALTPEEEQGPA